MDFLFHLALLALYAVGLEAQGLSLRCQSQRRSVLKQQEIIKRTILRYQLQVDTVRTQCHITIPNIIGPSYTIISDPNHPIAPINPIFIPPTIHPIPIPPREPNPPINLLPPPQPPVYLPIGVTDVCEFGISIANCIQQPPSANPIIVDPPVVDPPPVINPPPVVDPPIVIDPPIINPPIVNPPIINPPIVNPPIINPPIINPPVIYPPVVVSPPIVDPPVVNPPVQPNIIPIPERELTPVDIVEDATMTTITMITKYGYPSETHYVTTYDSYILCLHRIPRVGAPPILLVHGLMSSSAIWVEMGPSQGLAYKLYQQGYDVWMLNTRGNIYSRDHKNVNIKPSEYWDFSFHEIGVYDLPASIDMIISATSQQKIQYIGHSQGSTAFFVLCSELPHYNDKIALMQALSPTVYVQNTKSPVLKFLSLFKGKYGVLLNLMGGLEIQKDNTLIQQFRNHICAADLGSDICKVFEFVLCGFGWTEFNANMTNVVVGHTGQGASSVQVYHYAYMMNSQKFTRFNKAALHNQVSYENQAVAYNLTRVSCKVALHYSEDDWLAGKQDVQLLRQRIPNCIDNAYILQRGFSHYDYMISRNVNRLVYGRVLNNCHANKYVVPLNHLASSSGLYYQYGK